MAISGDYPRPISVNGYQCNNCSDVAKAKKFIDPAQPQAGVQAPDDAKDAAGGSAARVQPVDGAVSFGGTLSYLNAGRAAPVSAPQAGAGLVFDKSA